MSSDEDRVEIPAAYNVDTPSTNKNGLHLYPVSATDSGEGLPYAPADWPNPGDKWGWKVGKRIASSGYFLDRYLYLPNRLRGKQGVFASKLSVEQYIRSEFPSMDINKFFASFSWKIPSKILKGDWYSEITSSGMKSDFHLGTIRCMAGNNMCASLVAGNPSPETLICDICCSEPGFCRDCCCILCCKTICSAYGGYSYIRCEAKVNDGQICRHIAHIDCALRSYVAGTVGGSIGLDAEYFCRRCDSRSDLVSHVMKLLNICRTIDSRDDVESILNVSLCILRGSRKTNAKQLLRHIKLAMAKFLLMIGGTPDHDTVTSVSTCPGDAVLRERSSPQKLTSNFDYRVESLKLEIELDQTLQALRKSQDFEYRLAEERLFAQKNYIMNLYEHLHEERSNLASYTSMVETDTLVDVVLNRIDQIKREVLKLNDMKQVENGFGSTSKQILKDNFGLDAESS
ncbi:unnamed protein product [Withania somnifera]